MVVALSRKAREEFGFAGCDRNSSRIAAALSEQLSADPQRAKDRERGNSQKQSRPQQCSPGGCSHVRPASHSSWDALDGWQSEESCPACSSQTCCLFGSSPMKQSKEKLETKPQAVVFVL